MDYVIKSAKTQEEAIQKGLLELGIKRENAEIQVLEEEKSGFLGFGHKDAIVKIKKKEDVESFVKDLLYKDEKKSKKEKNFKSEIKKEKKENKVEIKKENKIEVKVEKKEPIKKEEKVELKPEKVEEKTEALKKDDKDIDVVKEKKENFDIWDNIELKNKTEEFLSRILDKFQIDYYLEIELKDDEISVDVKSNNEEDLGIVIGKYGSTLDALQYLLGNFINRHREEYLIVKLDSNGYRDRRNQSLRKIAKKGIARLYKYKRPVKLEPMSAQERRAVHLMIQENENVTTYSEGKEPYRRVVITFKKQTSI